jgi:hypothetical protein
MLNQILMTSNSMEQNANQLDLEELKSPNLIKLEAHLARYENILRKSIKSSSDIKVIANNISKTNNVIDTIKNAIKLEKNRIKNISKTSQNINFNYKKFDTKNNIPDLEGSSHYLKKHFYITDKGLELRAIDINKNNDN